MHIHLFCWLGWTTQTLSLLAPGTKQVLMGSGGEEEEHRGDTFNWRVPWSPASYSPANSCVQALREWELPQTNIPVTTALFWCTCLYIPKSTTGDECLTLKHQNGLSVLMFQASQAHPKCPNSENQRQTPKKWPRAKHCTVTTTPGPHTHQSKHRMVKTATSCCDFYTRVVFKDQLLPLWLWSALLKKTAKKPPFAGQHPTGSCRGWPNHEHQAGSGNLQNHFKFSFLYLGTKPLQAVSLIRIANISLKRKSLN